VTTTPTTNTGGLTEIQLLAWRAPIGYRKPLWNSERMIRLSPHLHRPIRPLIIGDHIRGMALAHAPMLEPPRLQAQARGPQFESVIKLPADQAQRLYQFFTQAYANPVPLAFNCHTFTRRVMDIGTFEDGLRHTCPPGYTPEPATPNNLEPGQPYDFVQARGHLVHSVIALDQLQCLSVLGWGKPIVIANTERFHFVYYGRTIHRILPETIDINRLPHQERTRYRHHGRHYTPTQEHES
jgi:hypothetical protein